jgi:hypothetical protein
VTLAAGHALRALGVGRARDVERHFTIGRYPGSTWSARSGPGRSGSRAARAVVGAPGRSACSTRTVAAADHAAVPVRQPDLRPGPDRTALGISSTATRLRAEAQAALRLLRDAGAGGGAADRPGGASDGSQAGRTRRRGSVRRGCVRRVDGGLPRWRRRSNRWRRSPAPVRFATRARWHRRILSTGESAGRSRRAQAR